ncbi:DUF1499 domain-containing protein [Okeania sp.]|uniref:DUF1499 domain-containing protein n=1 Tax=Okeania sp. TaxID=3100323 RepID=UPI002B4B414C|nr:DUF1499 domain-containing protein [Okeania sp.]MEB3342345.1 DUF1499 domain-containing protein [Okeania sp.]
METTEKKSSNLLQIMFNITIILLVVVAIVVGINIGTNGKLTLFAGTRPDNLGVYSGRLAPCPSSPNCVSSYSQDAQHGIVSLSYDSEPEKAIANLKEIIVSIPRTNIVKEDEDYLYAEFTSKIMGYVDDVEFYVDRDANAIQVRSASRLGESDLGVNRERVETIREKFNELKSV